MHICIIILFETTWRVYALYLFGTRVANQSLIIELGNFLSNQEALVKQMASNNKESFSQVEHILYIEDETKKKISSKHSLGDNKQSKTRG